jgi:hypothetical protein
MTRTRKQELNNAITVLENMTGKKLSLHCWNNRYFITDLKTGYELSHHLTLGNLTSAVWFTIKIIEMTQKEIEKRAFKEATEQKEIQLALMKIENELNLIDPREYVTADLIIKQIESEIFDIFVNQYEIQITWLPRVELYMIAKQLANIEQYITHEKLKQTIKH